MDAIELLTTTKAVRRRIDFDRPVPFETLEDCVRIAVHAPLGGEEWQPHSWAMPIVLLKSWAFPVTSPRPSCWLSVITRETVSNPQRGCRRSITYTIMVGDSITLPEGANPSICVDFGMPESVSADE